MEKLNFSTSNQEQIKQPNVEKTDRVFLGTTKDGAEVYDRSDSHLHNEGGMTTDILAGALSVIDTEGESFLKKKVDFDRPIGKTNCVEINPTDEIVMVYRKGRSGQTPMVKNRETNPCNSVMVVLKKDRSTQDKTAYELVTSYIGVDSPREPWDPGLSTEEERRTSEEYWRTHALVYDDNLIDWEKTKGFEFMSPSEKEKELIRPKVLYAGLFVDPNELYRKVQPTLEKPIEIPHITTAFKPDLSQLHLDQLGNDAKITAIGYGNDGKNEGLLVKIEADDPELQATCDTLETPHITLSVSDEGRAKDTAFLDFSPLEHPFEITGRYGLFGQGIVATDKADLEPKTEK